MSKNVETIPEAIKEMHRKSTLNYIGAAVVFSIATSLLYRAGQYKGAENLLEGIEGIEELNSEDFETIKSE